MGKFKFNYVPESELTAGTKLLTPGPATFVVKKIFENDKNGFPLVSRNNDPMVKLVIEATDSKGEQSSIFESFTAKTTWKAYALCKSVGRKDLYQPDGIDFEELKGLKGKCIVNVESSPGYSDKTVIASYEPHPKYEQEVSTDAVTQSSAANMPDDDLTF